MDATKFLNVYRGILAASPAISAEDMAAELQAEGFDVKKGSLSGILSGIRKRIEEGLREKSEKLSAKIAESNGLLAKVDPSDEGAVQDVKSALEKYSKEYAKVDGQIRDEVWYKVAPVMKRGRTGSSVNASSLVDDFLAGM